MRMRRREFIVGLGGVAAWSKAARAQQGNRPGRVGVLMGADESDPESRLRLAGLISGLAKFGWNEGHNLRLDVRWAGPDVGRMRTFSKELVGLQPDVIVASSTPTTAALQRETKTIPIVFATTSDPVGSGFVASLARPGGNITGFINIEAEMAGKWLELLIEIAPGVRRAALMFNPDTAASGGAYYLALFETAARSLSVTSIAAPVRNDADIETVLTELAHWPGAGLVVSSDAFVFGHRGPIITLAGNNKIPAVYWHPAFVRDGGLLSYGSDLVDIANQAATYVHRILNGAKPAELPVQLPTKYQLALNARTAKAIGLLVPPSLLLRADEVIE